MNTSVPGQAVLALLIVCSLCACAAPEQKDASTQPVSQPTYKPTGSHIVERSTGRRSPKNSSSAPVRDLEDAPAVTVIQNQPPK
jgi:hypothetical protein